MDHIFRTGVSGEILGMTEYIEYGRRPGAVYVSRFRNIDSKDDGVGFKRGYGFQGGAGRTAARSEERRLGNEGVRTGKSRWLPYNHKINKHIRTQLLIE